MVDAIILAEICCRAFHGVEKREDFRAYCGIYKGYFEDSPEKEILRITEDGTNTLKIASDKGASWRLVPYPFDQNFFSSAKGLMEFNPSGKAGFWLNYVQFFEKLEKDEEPDYEGGRAEGREA